MTRGSKEFKRRLRKMQKHVEALREISQGTEEHESLDVIQGGLNDLEQFMEDRERIPHGAGAGAPSGQGGVAG